MSIDFKTKTRIPTRYGEYELSLFKDSKDGKEHLMLCFPSLQEIKAHQEQSTLIRVHSECLTGEVLGSLRCDCREQLDHAMKKIAQAGRGIIIYLRQEGRGIGLEAKLNAYNLQDQGRDTAEANKDLGFAVDAREYDAAVELLKFAEVKQVALMTNNPLKKQALEDKGIQVKEIVPIHTPKNPHNQDYLQTKVQKMGHIPTS